MREETIQLRDQIKKAEKSFLSNNCQSKEASTKPENIKSNKKHKQTTGTQTALTTAQVASSNGVEIVQTANKLEDQLKNIRLEMKNKF